MSDAIDAKPVAGASVGPVVTSYKTYATRFIVALVFCLSSAMSSYILATFVTVWDLSMEFFGVDSMGINAFLLVYMAFFLPGSILSVYLMERYGLSTTVTVGALGNMVCCWWRFGGSMIGDDNTQARYAMVLTGQIIAALAQPALLNSPPRIANDWFPPHERDYAMWLTTQANTIGNAIGCLLPAYQVAVAHDIPYMLLWQAVAATGIVLLQLAFFRSARPPTPPAADVALQLEARAALGATATASVMSTLRQMAADTRTVLRNRTFLLILASFSVTIGINWVSDRCVWDAPPFHTLSAAVWYLLVHVCVLSARFAPASSHHSLHSPSLRPLPSSLTVLRRAGGPDGAALRVRL